MQREPAAKTLTGAWTLAVLAHVFWGLLAPGGKVLLQWWPSWSLNAVRMLLATALLMAWYGRRESVYAVKALLVDKHLVLLGVVGVGMTFALYVASLEFVEATVAAVLIFLAPFLTAAMARVFIGERSGWTLGVAASVTLVGAYLAIFGLDADPIGGLGPGLAFGLAINFASVVLWAVYTVHLKVVAPRYPLGRLTIASFVAATLFFVLSALLFDFGKIDWAGAMQPAALAWLGVYVLLPSYGAYLLYAASIDRVGAGPITILLGVELLVTSVLAHFVLDERFPPVRIVGLVLTTVAVVWFVYMQSRRAPDYALPSA